jgi:hypothetical protein
LAWTVSGALPQGRDRTSVGCEKDGAALPPMIATPRVDTVASPQEQQPRPPCALNRRSICATPAASLPAARRRLPLRLNADSGHSCVASNRSNPSPSRYQSNAKR